MTAILRSEAKQLRRGSLILTGVLAVITVFFLAVFPAMKAEAELIQDVYPDYMISLLGFEEIHTIEGFTAGYIYPFIIILFGGVYFAYIGAGTIARDIQNRKMDLILSNPVSRESVLAQKAAALVVPLVVLHVGLIAVLYGGAIAVGESFAVIPLVMAHVLSVPYLLVCAVIGITLSVIFDRATTAQVTALGAVFFFWLVEGLSDMEPDIEWLGDLMPSRYYNPSDVLLREEYAFFDASILLLAFLVLLGISAILFTRRDI